MPTGILFAAAVTLGWLVAGPAGGQLLARPGPEYSNYAIEGYRRMGREAQERSTNLVYDEFGALIMDGAEVYRLTQAHPALDDPSTPGREAGSVLRKGLYYNDYLARLVVAQDVYAGPRQRLIIGDRIRTRFSSLTMDQTSLNGIRWDLDLARNQFSLIASRVDRPIYGLEAIFDYEESFLNPVINRGLAESVLATYLLGGHWDTRVGIFQVGATYVNQFRVDTQTGLDHNGLKGTLPVAEPTGTAPALRPSTVEYLVVKVADETDLDGGGPRVYDVRIVVNGQVRDDLQPTVTRHDEEVVNPAYPNGDRFFPANRSIPPYVEYLKGFLPAESPPAAGYLEADRTGYLLYWFAVPPEGVREVAFEALVANDYAISLAEVYVANPLATASQPEIRNRATYFYRVAATPGRVTDQSNLRRVRFDYGRQTGVTVAGVSVSAEARGFWLRGEYSGSLGFRQYPGENGRYHDLRAGAWYLTVKRTAGPLTLGGEGFHLSPDYSTRLSVQSVQLADYTGPYFGDVGNSFEASYNNTVELDLVDDNDDRDPFPDTYFLPSRGDRDGVYPGLDADQDGRPDTNRNNNGLPDYFEPFLLYDVDPDDFAYGDDLNNNGVIDEREDDDRPDYPYDVDLRGAHLFAGLQVGHGLGLMAGHLDSRQITGGGRNRVTYGKLEYDRDLPQLGRARVVHTLKVVADDIRNDVLRYGFNHTFGPLGPILRVGTLGVNPEDVVGIGVTEYEDPLRLRRSVVHTIAAEGRLKRFRPFQLRGQQTFEVNDQRRMAQQADNRITTWTSVVAADYVWQRRGLTVRPQAKVMAHRRDDERGVVTPIFETYLYPILRLDYDLTPRSVLRAGVQGAPWLPCVGRDRLHPSRDYRSQDYLLMVSNRSDYSGYELSFNAGYQLRRLRMSDRSRRAEDIDYSLFFLRLVAGLRASEAR